MSDPELPVVPVETAIPSRAEAFAAIVSAIVDGDAATSQRVVDELGARARPRPAADGGAPRELDWS